MSLEKLYFILVDKTSKEAYKKDGFRDEHNAFYTSDNKFIEKSEVVFWGKEEVRDFHFKKYQSQKNKTAEEIFLPKYESLQKQVGGGHYKNMAITPAEFIIKNDIPWIDGDAIVYICLHKSKNGAEDLKKAIQCLEIALEFYYPNEAKNI
jgi:hypothetical protein